MEWVSQIVQNLKQLLNKRVYRRVAVPEIPVTISVKGKDKDRRIATIGNWSPGGLFLLTKEVLPLETLVQLEFPLGRESNSLVQLEAQVVRHQTNRSTGEMEGMGVMFTDFTQNGLLLLRDLLNSAYQ